MKVIQLYSCFLIRILSLAALESKAQQITFVNPVYNKDFADPTMIKVTRNGWFIMQ